MKKLILIALLSAAFNSFSQEEKSWRIGILWGGKGNYSTFSGGMENAHARFHKNEFGGGALEVLGRYDHNNHWMWTGGIGVSTFGYNFALTQNYSLRFADKHFNGIESSFVSLEVPVMAHYKFNLNCKNARWVLGAGLSTQLIGAQTFNTNQNLPDGVSPEALNVTATTQEGGNLNVRFVAGREKVYKKGGILNASFVINAGFKETSKAIVSYRADNENYQHEFSNTNNFFGFRLSYFFRPF
jgi:hypothetical protein